MRTKLTILLALVLALAGVLLIIAVITSDTYVLLKNPLELLIILLGLSISIFVSATIILQEHLEDVRQKSIREAQQEAFAEHRRFLRRLDHELKNPLTAVRAGISTLSLTVHAADTRNILSAIEAEVLRVSRLVADLRKLADLETLPLELSPINLETLFDEVLMVISKACEESHKRFIVTVPSNIPAIYADPDLLLLAVHNLLDNALKYTASGDTITLTAIPGKHEIQIQVIDSGIGIPVKDLPVVQEELFRGTNAENIPGSGVGLTLVKTIIERHGGWVEFSSGIANKGTQVSLHLPIA